MGDKTIPGYSGYIPRSTEMPGTRHQPSFVDKTLVVENHKKHMSGYTGCVRH